MIYILIAIALFIFLQWRSRKPSRQEPYQVVRHIDGDTTDFLDTRNNATFRVRYLVIDANERHQPGGVEATKYLTRLLPIGSRASIDFTGNTSHDCWEGVVYRRGMNLTSKCCVAVMPLSTIGIWAGYPPTCDRSTVLHLDTRNPENLVAGLSDRTNSHQKNLGQEDNVVLW